MKKQFIVSVLFFIVGVAVGFVINGSLVRGLDESASLVGSSDFASNSILPAPEKSREKGTRGSADPKLKNKIEVTQSGNILIDGSLANRLLVTPFGRNYEVDEEELALFGLGRSSIQELQRLTDDIRESFSDDELERMEVLNLSNDEVLLKIPGTTAEKAQAIRW